MNIITRQPKGIPVGGQFAAARHGEAGVALATAPASAPTEESILAAAEQHLGPGAVPGIRRRFAEVKTEAGRTLFLQRCDALYNGDSPYRVDRSIYGPSPEQCDGLAALGFNSVNQFTPDKLKNFTGVDSLIENGIGPERLGVLGQLPRHQFQWSAWEKEAYLTGGLADLEAIVADGGRTPQETYLATVALLGPEREARARRGLELGLTDRGMIELDKHPLEAIADLHRELPPTKRGALHIGQLADKGITATHLKTYSGKACEQYTARELEGVKVAPKTIRSFLASGVIVRLDDMEKLQQAGFTGGPDLKLASHAMGTSDADLLAEARRHATGEQMATFDRAISAKITIRDARAIAALARHGISDPAQLKPYTSSTHHQANQFCDRSQSILALHAEIMDAGITPALLGKMQRAGIPVDKAAAYKDSLDLWADGKKYRDLHDAEQTRKVQTKWIREATPWAYNEDTYANGLTF